MSNEHARRNGEWAQWIVDELVRNGADCFFVSPGSRCTPLALAIADHADAKVQGHFDERATAYCAVGYARASQRVAVLLCTSGTAVANYFPAVVEAKMAHVPLVLLSADRPPELRHCGANQTIDQVKLFGDHCGLAIDLPCPDSAVSEPIIRQTIDQLVHRSVSPQPGPVQLNCMFREPFFDSEPAVASTDASKWPRTQYEPSLRMPDPRTVANLSEKLRHAKRPLITVGALPMGPDQDAVLALSNCGIPIFADITSNLRLGAQGDHSVPLYDLLLTSETFQEACAPDYVLHFGDRPTSKRLLAHLAKHPPNTYIQVSESTDRTDGGQPTTHRLTVNAGAFAHILADDLGTLSNGTAFAQSLRVFQRPAELVLDRHLDTLNEPAVAREVARHLAPEHGLFLGSSMPIRDMDTFAANTETNPMVAGNRGASGIDGSIASAAGMALGLGAAVTALIGDLAFLHDLNALALLKNDDVAVTLVVINNDGGGIFSFLPIASADPATFEQFFGTPHDLTCEHAAAMFNLPYHSPASLEEFVDQYQSAQRANASSIIEVKSDRGENREIHDRIAADIARTFHR